MLKIAIGYKDYIKLYYITLNSLTEPPGFSVALLLFKFIFYVSKPIKTFQQNDWRFI